MITLNEKFYTNMFFLAGIWNICIGLTGLLFTNFSVALFFGADAVTGDFLANLMFRLFMVAIIAFGIGYCLVSRDPGLNRAVIILGLACKLILFVLFTGYFFIGRTTVMAVLAVSGDLAWSVLFMLFLYRTRDSVKHDIITG